MICGWLKLTQPTINKKFLIKKESISLSIQHLNYS